MIEWQLLHVGLVRCWAKSLADRGRSHARLRFQSGVHSRRRRQNRQSKNIIEQPFPAQHRRRPVGIRSGHQNRALRQQPSALIVIRQRDAPELAAVNSGNAVLASQPLIHERVVGVQQIVHAAVFLNRARHEHLRLGHERVQQAVVVGRILGRVDHHFIHAPQIQPLRGEVIHEGAHRARIGQHAPDFFIEVLRLAEFVVLGESQQTVVRNAAP